MFQAIHDFLQFIFAFIFAFFFSNYFRPQEIFKTIILVQEISFSSHWKISKKKTRKFKKEEISKKLVGAMGNLTKFNFRFVRKSPK